MGPVYVAKLQTKPPSRIHDSGALGFVRVRDFFKPPLVLEVDSVCQASIHADSTMLDRIFLIGC